MSVSPTEVTPGSSTSLLKNTTKISELGLLFLFLKKDLKCTYRRILPFVAEILMVILVTFIVIKICGVFEDRAGKRSTLKFEVNDWQSSTCDFPAYLGPFDPDKYREAFAACIKETYTQTNLSFTTVGNNTAYSTILKNSGQNFFNNNPFQTSSNMGVDDDIFSAYIANRLFTSFFSPVNWTLTNSVLNPVVSINVGLHIIQFLFILIFLIIAVFATSWAMSEKENNIHAYMIVMGLPRHRYYTSHFVTCTIKIWLYSIVAGIFIIKTSYIGLPMFFILFLYSHFIVYSSLCITTLMTRAAYAVLLTFAYHGLLIATRFVIDFSIFNPVSTAIVMIFHPFLAMQVAMENLFLYLEYYEPIRAFSEFGFYVPFGFAISVMVFHVVIAVVLTYYLDYVVPIDGTAKKHPLFFLCFSKKESIDGGYTNKAYSAEKHETLPQKMTPGIVIEDVTKKWDNGEIAVNHASFVALKNQVTGLLGHNGAGKSTLFGCLTGLVTPTSGRIEIHKDETSSNNGNDSIGYCPQWDPLFPLLTVVEHLNFYGTIKTGSSIDPGTIAEVIEGVGLQGSEHVRSRNLSGGQKRKLSVGIAIIGESEIILLDEPTAGMDPMARHDMIQIIKKIQLNRTILITTHYMDEAEAVANRVVILAKGEVVCSGSIDFLKKQYATGFLLTVVLADIKQTAEQALENAHRIVNTVRGYCPSAVIEGTVGNQFVILLPQESKRQFPQIFQSLEERQQAFKISSFGVGVNSLEQVFLKVNELADPGTDNANSYNIGEIIHHLNEKRAPMLNIPMQISAVFLRRLHYARRHYILLCFPYILLIALIVYALIKNPVSTEKIINNTDVKTSIDVNLAHGPQMTIVLVDPPSQYTDHLNGVKAQLAHPNVQFVQVDQNNALNTSEKWYSKFPTFGFQLGIKDTNGQHIYQLLYRNAFPTAPIIASQAITQYYLQGSGASIKGDFYETKLNVGTTLYLITASLSTTVITSILFAAPIFLYSFEENGTRHLYRLAKLSTFVYWQSSYIAETLIAILPCALLIVVNFQLQIYKSSDMAIIVFTFVFYGLAYITQMFCAAKIFTSPSMGFVALIIYNTVISSIVLLLGLIHLPVFETFMEVASYLFPQTSPEVTWKNAIKCMISAVIYFLVLILISFIQEYGGNVMRLFKKTDPIQQNLDSDVQAEETRVDNCDNQFAVCAKHLRKTYYSVCGPSKVAVNNLTFGVEPGECFGLLGANGAGKSTTFNMLTGGSVPTSGMALVDGRSLSSFFKSPEFGFCPQHGVVLDDLSVSETFVLFCRISGRVKIAECVRSVTELLKLTHVNDNLVKKCSGGEKRRIAVGVALLTNPKIIMLDEPTAGIDPRTRRRVWELLIGLRDNGTSEILSSHSMEECETLCTRIAFLSKGVLRAIGTSQHLKHTFSDTYVLKVTVSDLTKALEVSNEIGRSFPGAQILENSGLNASFSIPKSRHQVVEPLSKLYARVIYFVDDLDTRSPGAIKDYSLIDASLEQVFIATTSQDQAL